MIDTDKYMEDVEEKYNLIMNLMDDEEREFEIKTRIRLSNKMKVHILKLDTKIKRLREENDKLVKAVEEDNKILKKHIGIIGEIHFLEWAKKTHPVWLNNLKEGYRRHKEAKKNEIKE